MSSSSQFLITRALRSQWVALPAGILGAVALAVSLGGCSSGSSKKDKDPDVDPPPATSAATTFLVEGQVSADNRLRQVAAGVASDNGPRMGDRDLRAAPIEDADILVWLYAGSTSNPDNRLNDEAILAQTDEDGRFVLEVPETDAFKTADRVLVEVRRAGYIHASRIFRDLEVGAQLTLDMALVPEQVAVARTDEDAVFTASGERVLQFGVVRQSDGSRAVMSGARLAAASDEDIDMSVDIPVDRIPEGVGAVTAGMAYFDPSNAPDAEAFPGDFVGSGDFQGRRNDGVTLDPGAGNASAAEGNEIPEEYRLISTAFTQLRLSDPDGNDLQLAADDESPAAANASRPAIWMRVPQGTFSTITEDYDTERTGVQIPIYVYHQGSWKYVGVGTLYERWRGGEDDVYGDVLPPSSQDHSVLFAKLEIDAGNNWLPWWNIDWPIAFGDVQEYCAAADIHFEGTDPKEGYTGRVWVNMPDGGRQNTFVRDGRMAFTSMAADPAGQNWEFSFWNSRANRTETFNRMPVQGATCDPKTVAIENPWLCRVEGRVVRGTGDDQVVVPNRWVSVRGARFSESTRTNEDGEYGFSVACGDTLSATTAGASARFNVNNDVDLDEGGAGAQDDGLLVSGLDLRIENQPPSLTVRAPSTAATGREITLSAFSRDPEGDNITLRCVTNNCGDFTEVSRQGWLSQSISFEPQDPGDLEITLRAEDEFGASTEVTRNIQVEQANRSPRITRITRKIGEGNTEDLRCSGRAVALQCHSEGIRVASDVTYTAHAYDPDGDSISFTWNEGDTPRAVAVQSDSHTITQVQEGALPITVIADDHQSESGNATATITQQVVPNQPPEILTATVRPSRVPAADDQTNADSVSLAARAIDDFTQLLTYQWDVQNGDGTSVWTADTQNATIPVGALQAGRYSVKLTVTDDDGDSSERDLTLHVTASEVEVIIQ